MEERMSIIVYSGTVDKLMAVSILATGGAAMGLDVELFVTFWGLEAFRKDAYKTNMRISKDFEDYGPVMMEQMMAKKVPSWMENPQRRHGNRQRQNLCLQHDHGTL